MLAAEWRREADVRRGERQLETAERLLEAVDILRAQASLIGPTDEDMQATKGLILLRSVLLKSNGILANVEQSVQRIQDEMSGVTWLATDRAKKGLDDAADRFRVAAVDELAQAPHPARVESR